MLCFRFPSETRETIKVTIKFAKKIDPDYAVFSLATPYPGTRFYEFCKKLGLIKVKDWIHYNLITPIIETVDLTLAELKQLQIQAFKEFYLRPKWIAKQLVREGRKFLNVLKQILRVLIKSKLKGIIGFHPRL